MIDISVQNLVKGFEIGSLVLDGLSFTVNSGERVGILGPNGCGKTTLFRLLSGEYRPDEGEIMVAPGKRLGLISQIPVYPEGWTVEDVLRDAHRRVYAVGERLDELAERVDADERGDRGAERGDDVARRDVRAEREPRFLKKVLRLLQEGVQLLFRVRSVQIQFKGESSFGQVHEALVRAELPGGERGGGKLFEEVADRFPGGVKGGRKLVRQLPVLRQGFLQLLNA